MSEELPEPTLEKPDETPIMLTPPVANQDEVKKKNRKEFWYGVGVWALINFLVLPLSGFLFSLMLSFISGLTNNNPMVQSTFSIVGLLTSLSPS